MTSIYGQEKISMLWGSNDVHDVSGKSEKRIRSSEDVFVQLEAQLSTRKHHHQLTYQDIIISLLAPHHGGVRKK